MGFRLYLFLRMRYGLKDKHRGVNTYLSFAAVISSWFSVYWVISHTTNNWLLLLTLLIVLALLIRMTYKERYLGRLSRRSKVPTANIQALYTNTTAGTVASPTVMDAAIQDIVKTIDDNDEYVGTLIAGGTFQPYPHGLYRNALINSNFDFWQRGTSSSGGGYLADKRRLLYDGSGQVHTVSRQCFSPGQSDVPGNPRYYWNYQITTAATGQTFNALVQRIENARFFADSKMTLSYYAKAAASKQISVKATQDFGTGEVHLLG